MVHVLALDANATLFVCAQVGRRQLGGITYFHHALEQG